MLNAFSVALLPALAGCSGPAYRPYIESPCSTGDEASYACQIERYHKVAAQ